MSSTRIKSFNQFIAEEAWTKKAGKNKEVAPTKVTREIKTESDTSGGIPIWIWFIVGIVIVFVIASLT